MDQHIYKLCEQYLHIIYQGKTSQFTPTNIAETSGEILSRSINKLIPLMQLTENDVFVDLGSGNGKIVAQIFLATSVKMSIGIEIVPELHSIAASVLHRIKNDVPDFFSRNRKLTFINDDFLNIPLDEASVALINNTCFPPKLLIDLCNKINNTKSIRAVFSLRTLPALKEFVFRKAVTVECSWDTAICYYYSKT